MREIDKSKLVLVHSKDIYIADEPLESKEIGYYRDSWNRFKKNKASVVAFIIICIIMVFVLFGPLMKKYNLNRVNEIESTRLGNLVPKIPGLEKLGIFDGTKTLTLGKRFLNHMYHEAGEIGEGIILDGYPEALKQNPNDPAYADVVSLTVKVDYYKYVNYIKSYMPEGYYDASGAGNLGPVVRSLLEDEFQEAVAKNYVIDIVDIVRSKDPKDPNKEYIEYKVRLNEFMYALDQTPEQTYFWFGTTAKGGDLFIELWRGARISIIMALLVTVINSIIGLTIGSIAGYYGGVFDLLFDRFVEIISAMPFLVILTLLVLRFGSEMWVIVIAFTATGWIGSYGTGRMQFYRFKNREYVLAAKTLGASDFRIMLKHIFPNTLGLIVTGYALAIPQFVFVESTYSFLGIINYNQATSVGMLIKQGQEAMSVHPHLLLFPSLYIAILMIAFNLLGNGLRDAFNPALRGAE
jgi:oligopeptide transport system permease protein